MTVDATLLAMLVDPKDKGQLLHMVEEGFLYNPRARLRYPIVNGVPVLLSDEAIATNESEHERIIGTAIPVGPTQEQRNDQ